MSIINNTVLFRNANADYSVLSDTWHMAKDFNENHKLHSWVIHYDEVNFVLRTVITNCVVLTSLRDMLILLLYNF